MPEKTMQQAAKEIHEAVEVLTELVRREYPNRREVERRFVSKHSSSRRAALLVVMILASACLSFLGTVSTISACFLGDLDRPETCRALPGYAETFQRNEAVLERYVKLQERSIRNERRIKRLEESGS